MIYWSIGERKFQNTVARYSGKERNRAMTTAELVKKLMDAGASSEVVAICIQAVEDAYEEATAPKKSIRKRKAAEVVNLQAPR